MDSRVSLITIDNLRTAYNKSEILKGISLSVHVNESWAIIGKNGAGKSTLVKTVAALVKPKSGSVHIGSQNNFKCSARERAKKIAYVPQKPDVSIPYTVKDFILLGRYASMGMMANPTSEDFVIVKEAAILCDIGHLFDRMMNTLSGGEIQRVLLAGAVAQQTPILLLDEPTTYLDPAHERMFFSALARVHEHRDLTVMMVTHDINSAITNCTHVCGIADGKVLFAGTVDIFKARCPQLLSELFGISFVEYSSQTLQNPVYGTWGV